MDSNAPDAISADVMEVAQAALNGMSLVTETSILHTIARAILADRARSPLAAPVAEGWRPIETAPKDGEHVLLNLGETIPDLVDARVGQFITEKDAEELGEIVSASGGWIIWDTGGDWFVVPYADVFGWAPLPAAPGTAPSGTAEVEPDTMRTRDALVSAKVLLRALTGPDDSVAQTAISEIDAVLAARLTVEVREPDAELVRPIVGIENRTAQEVFDIMADRIRNRLSKHGGNQ